MRRGQLSLTVVEAAVGVLLVFAVTAGFALGTPQPDTAEVQLDAYARDAAAVLVNEPPRHQDATRLAEVSRSAAAFDRERDALRERVDRILPDNLMFRVRTPQGDVGYPRPAGVPLGSARATTPHGPVRIWVWYV